MQPDEPSPHAPTSRRAFLAGIAVVVGIVVILWALGIL